MQWLFDFCTNYYVISAIAAWLIAQIIKVFTGVFKLQEFSLKAMFFGTGGMPSSHTAAACALCVACALKDGLGASSVAISGVLAMIVMIDAAGVRNETGKQSKALNMIIGEMFSDSENADLHFKELIGHSPLQILCGAITGVVTAGLLYLLPVFSA
ncbi:MAG: divergent PAP2 family protein [Ruminococcaceae bacterium]|nr:divergent PAP2 family protein [Oscillospiraceae bacterium]